MAEPATYSTVADALADVKIVEYVKPNGNVYYRVMLGDQLAGQFFTRGNARIFIKQELEPWIRLRAVRGEL